MHIVGLYCVMQAAQKTLVLKRSYAPKSIRKKMVLAYIAGIVIR
jgi:hypothetical protein